MKTRTLLFSALVILSSLSLQAKSFEKKVSGSGNVTTEERQVSSFNEIRIEGAFNVILSQGNKEAVQVEADDNLQEYIEVEMEGQTLVLAIQHGIQFKDQKKATIHVTLKDIKVLANSGVGNIKCGTDLKLQSLELSNNGVGNICLKGHVHTMHLDNSGVGNVDVTELPADKLSVQNNGVGNVDVTANEELEIENNGVGNVSYGGNPKVTDIHSNGVGRLKKRSN